MLISATESSNEVSGGDKRQKIASEGHECRRDVASIHGLNLVSLFLPTMIE